MKPLRRISLALLALGLVAGTLSDKVAAPPPMYVAGFRVLAVDFHVHPSFFSDGAIAPWDLAREARRQGLDAFALCSHNQMFTSRLAVWLSQWLTGALVIPSEEIQAPHYHMIAAGIHDNVAWRQSASSAIDDIHRQGGIAIAAHPVAKYWSALDNAAVRKLDGAEVLHPVVYAYPVRAGQIQMFYERALVTRGTPLAAIGSSDYHATLSIGECRTFVFVREFSVAGILEAVRAQRTVVFDRRGRVWGDPDLIYAAIADGRLQKLAKAVPERTALATLSKILAALGLFGLIALSWWN